MIKTAIAYKEGHITFEELKEGISRIITSTLLNIANSVDGKDIINSVSTFAVEINIYRKIMQQPIEKRQLIGTEIGQVPSGDCRFMRSKYQGIELPKIKHSFNPDKIDINLRKN